MRITIIWAAIAGAFLAPQALAEGPLHGRISEQAGQALIRGDREDDWSYATLNTLVLEGDTIWAEGEATLELELPGGVFVRFADRSKAEIAQISPDVEVRAWTGSFYLQRLERSTVNAALATKACEINARPNSMVRVDVLLDGSTTVSVRWGSALIQAHNGPPTRVDEGQRVFIDPGMLPSQPLFFDRTAEDGFDAWNRERAKLLALGRDALRTAPATPVSTPVYGSQDLAPYGEWVYVEERPYWRPTVVVNFVPYREGYWSHVEPYGYTWVGSYPFSYVTTHYGRWTHNGDLGWLWTYVDGWAPAWCATVQTGSYCVWTPLDLYNRPVQYGGAAISIGGYGFSYGASSYCYSSDLLNYGYANPSPYNPAVLNQFIVNGDVNIWNIGGAHRRGLQVDYPKPIEGVREYNPRRSIRGFTGGKGSSTARARAVSLEDKTGTVRFERAQIGGRAVRTPLASTARKATLRQPNVRGDAVRSVRAQTQRIERISKTAETARQRSVRGQGGRDASNPSGDAHKQTHAAATESPAVRVREPRAASSRTLSAYSAARLGASVRSRRPGGDAQNPVGGLEKPERTRIPEPSKVDAPPQRTRTPAEARSADRGSQNSEFRGLSRRYETRRGTNRHDSPAARVERTPTGKVPSAAASRTPSRQAAPQRVETPNITKTPQRTFRNVQPQRAPQASRPSIRFDTPSSRPQPAARTRPSSQSSPAASPARTRPSASRTIEPTPTPAPRRPSRAPDISLGKPSGSRSTDSNPSVRSFKRNSGSAGRGISKGSSIGRGFSRARR